MQNGDIWQPYLPPSRTRISKTIAAALYPEYMSFILHLPHSEVPQIFFLVLTLKITSILMQIWLSNSCSHPLQRLMLFHAMLLWSHLIIHMTFSFLSVTFFHDSAPTSHHHPLSRVKVSSCIFRLSHLPVPSFFSVFFVKLVFTPAWYTHWNSRMERCTKGIALQAFVYLLPCREVDGTLEITDQSHSTGQTSLPISSWTRWRFLLSYVDVSQPMPTILRLPSHQ